MGTIFQELQRLLNKQKDQGTDCAWVSPENLKAFYQLSAASLNPARSTAYSRPAAAAPVQSAPAARMPNPRGFAPQQANPPAKPVTPQSQQVPSTPVAQPPISQTMVPPRPATPLPPQRFGMGLGMPSAPAQQVPLVPMPDVTAMDWDALRTTAQSCKACRLYAGRTNMVFDDGLRQARVMFIGEGPGEDEDRQGVPFVGRAGQLLTRMILAMGLDRASQDPQKAAYIANIVKCRPPKNRNPEPDEGTVCIAYLKRQIQLVRPQAIVLLGNVPLNFLLNKSGITRLRGQWMDYDSIPVMPTFHPAYLLRFESNRERFIEEKRKVWADLQLVMAKVGLPLPR